MDRHSENDNTKRSVVRKQEVWSLMENKTDSEIVDIWCLVRDIERHNVDGAFIVAMSKVNPYMVDHSVGVDRDVGWLLWDLRAGGDNVTALMLASVGLTCETATDEDARRAACVLYVAAGFTRYGNVEFDVRKREGHLICDDFLNTRLSYGTGGTPEFLSVSSDAWFEVRKSLTEYYGSGDLYSKVTGFYNLDHLYRQYWST